MMTRYCRKSVSKTTAKASLVNRNVCSETMKIPLHGLFRYASVAALLWKSDEGELRKALLGAARNATYGMKWDGWNSPAHC